MNFDLSRDLADGLAVIANACQQAGQVYDLINYFFTNENFIESRKRVYKQALKKYDRGKRKGGIIIISILKFVNKKFL